MPTASPPASKKRKSRTGHSTDEHSGDENKKRGRPRVEKEDESAADRRRTQIRMAQRAYRQRKESTLEELRKRVSGLTNTIELMNKTFMDHRDRLFDSHLSDMQQRDLRNTAMQFESLMITARNPTDSPAEDLAATESHRESASSTHGSIDGPGPSSLEPKNVTSWIDRSAVSHHQQLRHQHAHQGSMGYTMYMQGNDNVEMEDDYMSTFDATTTPPMPSMMKESYPSPQNDFDIFRMELPEIAIPPSLEPLKSFAHKESTFARRLHRLAIERAYQLVLNFERNPITYARVFRLSLMSRDREKLMGMLRKSLDRSADESLDQDSDLIHVGGAGTHYPKRDEHGNWKPKKSSWYIGIIGPQMLARLENAAKDRISVDMTVEIAGMEGEWLDPYDVEGYLAEKGIYIDPSASFAEAEVAILPSVPSSTTSGTDSVSSFGVVTPPPDQPGFPFWQQPQRAFDDGYMRKENGSGINAADFDDTWASNTVGFSDALTGNWMNFMQPGENVTVRPPLDPHTSRAAGTLNGVQDLGWDGMPSPDHPHLRVPISGSPGTGGKQTKVAGSAKKSIILDVAHFLETLTATGTCLTRAAGYRRSDVDRALALASFDAF
ncbi:hypothetical protein CERZMDRAFT_104841 [Cercospora zeae-maydis SCOH1-5]|uniref:BZIP domain-containing protein n=1 Tax=Cercospora zeae-maydis SCOH1-5 TaxID=717836 RepID=A0A6A6FQC6_9PEZI|nr:hypothetical protein CERZMDRAFT_104841 [Cercospora zeae-maydis SCOH1-5]